MLLLGFVLALVMAAAQPATAVGITPHGRVSIEGVIDLADPAADPNFLAIEVGDPFSIEAIYTRQGSFGRSFSLRMIYVGPLPPQRGGCPTVAARLLLRLAERGHQILALAPVSHPGLGTTAALGERVRTVRFPMPYYHADGSRSPPKAYLGQQIESVRSHLIELSTEEAPDLILAGREDLIWGISAIGRAEWRSVRRAMSRPDLVPLGPLPGATLARRAGQGRRYRRLRRPYGQGAG